MKNVLEPEVMDQTHANLAVWQPPQEPSWERAKMLAGRIRAGAEAIVLLGQELEALRNEFYRVGSGKRNDLQPMTQGASKVSKGLTNGQIRTAQSGWQAAVREQLGISHETAARWIERASVIVMLKQLQAGEAVRYLPNGKKEWQVLEPLPEVVERVEQTIDSIVTGVVAAPRAWAGLTGETMRRAKQGGLAAKAPTDHAENIRAALAKLKTSLPHWRKLDAETRMELETTWEAVLASLPDTWARD